MNYQTGDIVKVRRIDGTYLVRVTHKTPNVKNELPGWDGIITQVVSQPQPKPYMVGLQVWGYNDQILEVL